ncbi:MAG: type I-C CRISPR-associated endonuclease Cas1c [Eubacteriales bacterium]
MKKLLNTLYISSPDRYLSLNGENIVISDHEDFEKRFPLHNFESIVTCSYTGASPALMRACAERGIALIFLSAHGRFIARVTGETRGNVVLRREQYRIADDAARSLEISRLMICAKLTNSRWVLERTLRDNGMRVDTENIKLKSMLIANAVTAAREAASEETLRGIEGDAAVDYFSVFDDMILKNKEEFAFRGRSRRPPLDNINALLSFAYSQLSLMCVSALEAVGLDPYVGFMHADRPGRASLALDLCEELRAPFADRFVVGLINRQIISPEGFEHRENGSVVMTEETIKAFFNAWQTHKMVTLKHPFLGEEVEWGMIPYIQALLLAHNIRGDIEAYPPFLWK